MSLRMGLIGLGGIYAAHAEGYRRSAADARVAALCDVDAALAGQRATEFPGARPFTDFREMLSSGLIDAVDIMLPHSLHETVAAAALEQGVHVLLEKPATPTVAGFDRLLGIAERNAAMLAIAENTRYVTAYRAAQELIERSELGEVQFVRSLICGNETQRLSQTDLWKGRRDGTVGGVILDAGAHSFYLLSWLLGPSRSVTAHQWKRVAQSQVEDVAVVTGELAPGMQFVTEYIFTAEIPWSERVEIYGSSASLIIDQLASPVARLFRGKRDLTGVPVASVPYGPGNWKRESIAAEVQDFISSVLRSEPTSVRPGDIRNALVSVEAAYTSATEGRTITLEPER
jgi:predicted dehydrogenase